jgi:WD40 repeat protein/DNA-binding SARP family transcriptional activator
VHINLLGPIEAVSNDGAVSLGGAKQRAVLAMLALQAGSTVSADRLIDGLWGDRPPASALKLVQLYVSHLRRAIGEEEVIATHGRGYELCLARQDVDAGRFERLLAQGAAREALRLWRGSPLADVEGEPFAAAEIRRLEELHTAALEVAIDQDLDAGRHREVLPEIDGLLAAEPLREPIHARRMLALYRCGRQADALEAYRDARRTLIEQVGVEPGPELRGLHDAMLRQDPALDPPADGSRHTPLFGRERELDRLRLLWRRVREGASATALITGEPGIGKTRLSLALAEEVRREGGAVRWDDDEALTLALDGGGANGHPSLVVRTSVEPDGIMADERIALGPLAPGDAAGLARFDAGDDGPVDRIVSTSRGVPGLIRQAARDWARAQAMARVADAAARTSADRLQWQLAEGDLTTRVVQFQEIREPASSESGACPYKGLESFDVDDAAVFFGRERLVAEMVARLPGARLLGIVGPSGSGKSSALRAGLLAAIGAGVLPGSESWPRAVIRPGEHPLQLLPEAPAGRAVLAVDQFEELFTVCRDERERAAFVAALRDRARHDTIVLVAVRADFYGACARYPELSRLLGGNHVLVGPMQRDELRRAVTLPARHAGRAIEPGLADALVADVEQEPGALPLLSTALFELWDEGLTLDAYERTGGVRGAVARLAETAYRRLGDDGRAEARRILLRLAGDGDVRTRVPLGELGDGAVLSALARDRLVTVSEDEAEVAHEALLREWPRLRSWLEEGAEGRRLHRHLTLAARDWGGEASELYRGARLASVLDWLPGHEADLSEREREFLAASRAAAERESVRQRRANRRLRVLLAGLACLLALAVVAGIVALDQRGEARRATVVADAQRLGEEAQLEVRFDRALLLARAGVALDDSLATRGSLLSVLQRNPPALGAVDIGWRLYTAAISGDSRLMAVGDERGVVSLFDPATRRPVGTYTVAGGLIQRLRFSPDGQTLAAGSSDPQDQPGRAIVDLIDARTLRLRKRIHLEPLHRESAYTLAVPEFVAGGDLDIVQMPAGAPGDPPSVVYRVDADTGAVRARATVGRHASSAFSATADGRRVFLTGKRDHTTWMLDATTLRVLRSYPTGEDTGTVSADGHVFALGSQQGRVSLLNTATGAVRELAGGDGRPIGGMRFTPDGRKLVTAGDQGTLLVWDVGRGEVAETLTGHTEEGSALDVSGDGRALVSGSSDGRAIVFDLAGDRRLERPFPSGGPFEVVDTPRGIAVTPDSRTLAFTRSDGGVQLMDARTLRPERQVHALRRRPGPSGPGADCVRCAAAVTFSRDGQFMAVGGGRGQVILVDARTLRRVGAFRGLRGAVQALAFSPDGKRLAAAEVDVPYPRTFIWDVRTRRLTAFRNTCGRRDAQCSTSSLAFSPNGQMIAEARDIAGTEIRDVRTGRLITTLAEGGESRSVAFSPNGKLVMVGQFDGKGFTFSTDTWKRLPQSLDEHTKRINYIVFTPDSRTLATASEDGTVQLWDVATDKRIGGPISFETGTWAAATFSRDGRYLYAMSTTGDGIRLDMSPAAWSRHACQMAGRELTVREWQDALPGRPYRRLCGATATP